MANTDERYSLEDILAEYGGGREQKTEPPPAITHGNSEFPFSVLAKTVRKVLAEYGERILVKSKKTA